jgi:uncharacterized protein (TIGR02145 family)
MNFKQTEIFAIIIFFFGANRIYSQTVKDIDGNDYKIVTIGTQTWMAENLRTIQFNDGTAIPLVTDSKEWNWLETPAYCWYNNDEGTNKTDYGALYNYYTIKTGKLCPDGWRVPSDNDWTVLTDFLGGLYVAGGKMKEAGTNHWVEPNLGADNTSGFTALPTPYRFYSGTYFFNGAEGEWWASDQFDETSVYTRGLKSKTKAIRRFDAAFRQDGYCVRCLKN